MQPPSNTGLAASQATIPTSPYKPTPIITQKFALSQFFTAPGKRILVVDDMLMNLQVLTGLLKRSEMTIETASGG